VSDVSDASDAYYTPDEQGAVDIHRMRVRAVIAEARENATGIFMAMMLGEEHDVVSAWVDRLWNGLRDNLSDEVPEGHVDAGVRDYEDRLMAIVLLIEDAAYGDARRIIEEVRNQ
jgi:hypothetical protein